jgi:two-component system nitrogen regulation sensor histidine kinase NtrY
VTLASRLLLATLVLGFGITLGFAWLVKRSWEHAEEERFELEFQRAIAGLEQDLVRTRTLAQGRLDPLCAHGTLVDSALAGLESDTLTSRLLSIKLALDQERQALGLEELALLSDRGQLLAGTWRGLGPSQKQTIDLRWAKGPGARSLRAEPSLAFEVGCKAASGARAAYLLGAVAIAPILSDSGRRHNLGLRLLDEPAATGGPPGSDLVETVELRELEGRPLEARRSRSDLARLLDEVDLALLTVTLVVLGGAAAGALFVARALSRPVALFAERTRDVLRGNVEPLPVTGGRELEQAARAFNQALADLAELRRRLELTERIVARREVARQVAHEVSNPLMPIRTSIETLRKLKQRDPSRFDTYFDEATGIVLFEVARLTRLVESFAAYARLPDPKLDSLDLTSLCRDLVLLFGQAAAAQGVAVEFIAAEPLLAYADRDQLHQAISNLIKNAIDACLASRETARETEAAAGRVRVSVGRAGGPAKALLQVVVEDDAGGIPPANVPRLFTPYFTTKASGTGLGLPIAQRVAVEHGGDLTYASSPIGGAAFTLSLKADGEAALPESVG